MCDSCQACKKHNITEIIYIYSVFEQPAGINAPGIFFLLFPGITQIFRS